MCPENLAIESIIRLYDCHLEIPALPFPDVFNDIKDKKTIRTLLIVDKKLFMLEYYKTLFYNKIKSDLIKKNKNDSVNIRGINSGFKHKDFTRPVQISYYTKQYQVI